MKVSPDNKLVAITLLMWHEMHDYSAGEHAKPPHSCDAAVVHKQIVWYTDVAIAVE